MNIATPPRRGVGVWWTSRSRIGGCRPYLTPTRRARCAKPKVMPALTTSTMRYPENWFIAR